MKLLMTIIDRKYSNNICDILNSDKERYFVVSYAKGTASSEMLDYFGIAETDKDVILCLVDDEDINHIFKMYESSKPFVKNHGGVAFTIPLTNIGKKFYDLIQKYQTQEQEKIS